MNQFFDIAPFPGASVLVSDAEGQSRNAEIREAIFEHGNKHAIRLPPCSSIVSTELSICSDYVLILHVAVPKSGSSNAILSLSFDAGDSGGTKSMSMLISINLDTACGLCEQHVEISLRALAGKVGKVRVTSLRGLDDCFISRFSVGPHEVMGLLNGLSGYAYRLRCEIQNFSGAAYTHSMYDSSAQSTERKASSGYITREKPANHSSAEFTALQEARAKAILGGLLPAENEAVFNFALRCLGALIPATPPNFITRIQKFSDKRPLRILSICCGAARIEELILTDYFGEVEITLLDASKDLISRAASKLQSIRPNIHVECLIGDINDGLPGEGDFDIVICVSALHHVVNLELVLSQINARLSDDGEFWSIGEQIGRNGNRLWSESREKVDELFNKLPARFRKNSHTGLVDVVPDDRDFSINCFEGIRSQELEAKLDAFFIPVDVYKRNGFLWRLVDTTYADNFCLSQEEDVRHLKNLVFAEALLWVEGGRSTELHGVYRKKQISGLPAVP